MLTTQNIFSDDRVVDIGGIVDFDTKLGLEFEIRPWTLRMALCQLPDPLDLSSFSDHKGGLVARSMDAMLMAATWTWPSCCFRLDH